MKRLLAIAALAALSGCSTLAGPRAPSQQGLIEHGRDFASENCAACHAIGATGESPASHAPPFREIEERFDANGLNAFISQGVSTSHPRMPWFDLNKSDVTALAAYLRSVQDQAQQRQHAP